MTKKIIAEIGAGDVPMTTVFNKADLSDSPVAYPKKGFVERNVAGMRNVNLYLCAKERRSIELL